MYISIYEERLPNLISLLIDEQKLNQMNIYFTFITYWKKPVAFLNICNMFDNVYKIWQNNHQKLTLIVKCFLPGYKGYCHFPLSY